MSARPIQKNDYSLILELDKKAYPTDSPVTLETIAKWYERNHEFGIIYEQNNKVCGTCISIPLNSYGWNALIKGKLAESEMNSETIFNSSRDRQLGVHIYHMEKLVPTTNFHRICLGDLIEIVKNTVKSNKNLEVIGFSGLCTTNDGINLCTKELNCKEEEFICKEYVLEKDGKRVTYNADSEEKLNKKIKEGYKIINRCKMLIARPSENDLWKYLAA